MWFIYCRADACWCSHYMTPYIWLYLLSLRMFKYYCISRICCVTYITPTVQIRQIWVKTFTYYCVFWICCIIYIRPTVQTREIWVLMTELYYITVIIVFMNMLYWVKYFSPLGMEYQTFTALYLTGRSEVELYTL